MKRLINKKQDGFNHPAFITISKTKDDPTHDMKKAAMQQILLRKAMKRKILVV